MKLFRAQDRTTGPTVHEIAADWLLREEEGRLASVDISHREAWLAADPSHRQALADVRLALVTASEGAADPELMAMRTHALATRPERAWPLSRSAAAVAAAILVSAGAWWTLSAVAPSLQGPPAGAQMQPGDPNAALYRTAVGERALITFPDGSVATLDTDSEIKVAYTGNERGVHLLRGQALFEVAKHKPTPFQVYAGRERVTAVGTTFNVRLDGGGENSKVSVALLEGVVTVSPAAAVDRTAPRQSVTMAPGELLEAKAAAPLVVVAADTERVTSWRSGVLIFNDTPLAEAVAEMNRYTTRPIVLADPKLASLRISGVFKTGDPEHFAETVSEAFPVTVSLEADGSLELEPGR